MTCRIPKFKLISGIGTCDGLDEGELPRLSRNPFSRQATFQTEKASSNA